MEKGDYEHNPELGSIKYSLPKELDRIMDQEYWPKRTLKKTIFHYHGILEHAAYHVKFQNILLHSSLKILHVQNMALG